MYQACHNRKQMSPAKVPANVFICKILSKFKQRSFEVFIGTSFCLFDTDLLFIWMNKCQLGLCFRW